MLKSRKCDRMTEIKNMKLRRYSNMDWLPFAFFVTTGIGIGLYTIVKCAVKSALKEYFEDKEQ